MIKIVLSPVSSSPLKTTEYHQKANFTRLISGFSRSARHSDILYNYICVYVTHNMYIYINIFIHTWIHTYIQTDRHRYIDTYPPTPKQVSSHFSCRLPISSTQYREKII